MIIGLSVCFTLVISVEHVIVTLSLLVGAVTEIYQYPGSRYHGRQRQIVDFVTLNVDKFPYPRKLSQSPTTCVSLSNVSTVLQATLALHYDVCHRINVVIALQHQRKCSRLSSGYHQ